MRDPRSSYVGKLNRAYRRRKLSIFVGAGISQGSGLPSWEPLNKGLLQQYLHQDIGSSTPAALMASPNIQATAEALYGALGRDAVADFVYNAEPKMFPRLLASVLYQGRSIEDLPLTAVHHQIAAFSPQARIATLNFDPLLELAMRRRFSTAGWREFRSAELQGKRSSRRDGVEHLHGWIDPDGATSRRLVLTESQYIELTADAKAPANQILKEILATGNVTLIMGMSLADQNFRRILYFLNKHGVSSLERIYVITVRQQPAIDHYFEMHWKRRGLRLLFLENYDEIPGLLRDVQWGEPAAGQLPRWVREATLGRRNLLPDKIVFRNSWQNIVHSGLAAMCAQIKKTFGLSVEEELTAGFFLSFSSSSRDFDLRLVGFSKTLATPEIALLRAQNRRLQIHRGAEQGVAGVSFATGTTRAISFGEGIIDINFTPEMIAQWVTRSGYRDWRSILSVPIMGTEFWLPIGVVTLTSNMAEPFWRKLGSKQDLLETELHTILRRTAEFCLASNA